MTIKVKIIKDSVSQEGIRLTTMQLYYPRIIHSELMTHRVFSRNARSSRAVPVKTMIQEVRETPFVPWHWGKNQKGMQAGEELDAPVSSWHITREADDLWQREDMWRSAANVAANHAEAFSDAGYHKQICNRLLEPFMWIDVLVTATDWANFLWLRDHKDAEPHLQDLARLVKQAIDDASHDLLKPGEWHLPYISEADRAQAIVWAQENQWSDIELLQKLSSARCARISYAPFDGDASYERELERYDSLVKSDRVHASPLEHQATPDRSCTISPDIFFWDNEELVPDLTLDAREGWVEEHLHGNLQGWIQYRKTVPGECHHA